jgi:hypothetical protein
MKILDIKGKELEIKSVDEGIAEADTYLWFTDASKNKELFDYWYHVKHELIKIKEQENNS